MFKNTQQFVTPVPLRKRGTPAKSFSDDSGQDGLTLRKILTFRWYGDDAEAQAGAKLLAWLLFAAFLAFAGVLACCWEIVH